MGPRSVKSQHIGESTFGTFKHQLFLLKCFYQNAVAFWFETLSDSLNLSSILSDILLVNS